MDIFIVQWCNVEEYDEMDVEIFQDLESANNFLRKIIQINYPKDHIDDLEDDPILFQMFKEDDFETELDHDRLFPYLYKITRKRINKK